MKRTIRQRYRVIPTRAQEAYFPALLGACRATYNAFLWTAFQDYERSKTAERFDLPFQKYTMTEIVLSVSAFSKQPAERAWMREYPAWTLQSAARDGMTAFQNWWSHPKSGKPRYKKRWKNEAGARFQQPKTGFKLERLTRRKSRVWINRKVGWITFRDTRPDLPLDASSVTLVREPTGKYYLSFVVQQEIAPDKHYGTMLSADLGLTDLLVWTRSNGERGKTPAARHYRRAERKLQRLQRECDRKQDGSKNQAKQKQKLAVQHEKVRHARQDMQRQIASRMASDNQVVILETLSAAGMKRNRHLAKSVSDAAFGSLVEAIRNACEKRGTQFVQIDRWQPTTKVCSQCAVIRDSVPLHVRTWECADCGALLDRDYNAAVNIMLAGGTTESLNACGEDIRALALVQTPALSEAGTHQYTAHAV